MAYINRTNVDGTPFREADQAHEYHTSHSSHSEQVALHEKTSDEGHSREQVKRAATRPSSKTIVRHARAKPVAVKRLKKRYVRLSEVLKREIEDFLNERPEHRVIPWEHLRFFLDQFWNVLDSTIIEDMESLDLNPTAFRRETILTRQLRDERINFAQQCLETWPEPNDWSEDGIPYVLFSGLVWFHANRWSTDWITIYECDDPTEWNLLMAKGRGWAFWGSFTGKLRGPHFIWPKEHGGYTADKYVEHILPLVDEWTDKNPGIMLKQDDTVIHRDNKTRDALGFMGIRRMIFPRDSPDLDPMMDVWRWMNEYLHDNYNMDGHGLEDVKTVLWKCWSRVPEHILEDSAKSMPMRLQKVIDNDGDMVDIQGIRGKK